MSESALVVTTAGPGLVASSPVLGQLRLGLEPYPLRNSRFPAPLAILRPHLGQVQLPIQKDPPLARSVAQEYFYLAVSYSTRRPTVLTLHPHRLGSLLQESRLVHHQHTIRVPHVVVQQPLHSVGRGITS